MWGGVPTGSMKGMFRSNIPLTVPSRVTGVTVTKTMESGKATLKVTWTPPQSDVAITQYQVEYRTSGMPSWINATHVSVSPPATSTNVTGLDGGTEYEVRVRAVSVIGAGEWSVEQTVRNADSE